MHRDIGFVGKQLAEKMKSYLSELKNLPAEELLTRRYQKFRALGEFVELEPTGKEETQIKEQGK